MAERTTSDPGGDQAASERARGLYRDPKSGGSGDGLFGAEAARRLTAQSLERKARFARTAIAVERAVSSFWPMFAAVFAGFAAFSFGLFGALGEAAADWGGAAFGSVARGAALLAALAAVVASARYGWRRYARPTLAEGRARLDEGAPDRPVASFDEEIELGRDAPDAEALWRAHQRRVTDRARRVRPRWPSLKVGGARDPFALRFFAVLALLAALLFTPGRDLSDAFAPLGLGGSGDAPTSVELWASPPDYTGLPPLYFATAEDRLSARRTPVGTVVSVRVFHAAGRPSLSVSPTPEGGVALSDEGEGVYAAEFELSSDTALRLEAGGVDGPLADLRFEIIPDTEPTVAYVEPPERAADAEMAFSFVAADDYGVAQATARIVLDPAADLPTPPEAQEPVILDLPIPPQRAAADTLASLDPAEDAEIVSETFEKHPWVGLPVVMTLEVEDAAGQKAMSEPARFILPGRLFSEPVAKALIEQRGAISWNVERAARANRILMAGIKRPEEYFRRSGDYLVTRTAVDRLDKAVTADRVAEDKSAILASLYAAAEILEDTGFDNARERLTRAQRRLREAIERGAPPEEIAQLMEELREAVGEYLQALRELAERNPELAQQMQQEGQTLSGNQLQEMLRALEEAAQNGEMSEAEQMLSMLEQLLNNLQPGGRSQQAGDGEPGREQSELEQLQDMIERQQRLAEESYDEFLDRRRAEQGQQGEEGQQGQQGQQGPQGEQGQSGQQFGQRGEQGQGQGGQGQRGSTPGEAGPEGQDQAGRGERGGEGRGPMGGRSLEQMRQDQQALRDALRDLRRDLDAAGSAAGAEESAEDRAARAEALERAERALDRAERSMERAEQALRDREAGEAAEQQMRAADAMRDGGRAAREALQPGQERSDTAEAGERRDSGGAERGAFGRDADANASRNPLQRSERGGPGGSGDNAFTGDGERVLGADGENLSRGQAREILNELRRRLGDRQRTPAEREYLQRLLERFR
ncbi:MAG: DUF4175 family protein [Pseudomonadota bacterium]